MAKRGRSRYPQEVHTPYRPRHFLYGRLLYGYARASLVARIIWRGNLFNFLLPMATGTKSVATTTGKILEKDIQRAICDWLALGNYFFWRSNNTPVYGASGRNHDGAMRFRALPKYTPRGLPDIIVIHRGKFVALEVKRPGQKLRPEQADFGMRTVVAGGEYHKVCSLKDVLAIKSLL